MSTVTFRLRWGELTAMPHTQVKLRGLRTLAEGFD